MLETHSTGVCVKTPPLAGKMCGWGDRHCPDSSSLPLQSLCTCAFPV